MVRKGHGLSYVAAALVVALMSCSKGPEVIPKRQMEKIYREMFLADQWLTENHERRAMADTTWFYAPVFEKYGYDIEDYRASVDYYLSDPKRYAEMIGRVAKSLEEDASAINRSIRQQEKIRHRADSIAKAMKAYRADDIVYYGDIFYVNSMTDRIDIRKNNKGVYFPVPVVEDTVFHGPELIIKDSATVAPAAAVADTKPVPWRD
ncbi:MAG: DUF4296 domain-containing protein [Bacteroidales bacterium]|nr:DUF4296 domain-containing protein [Bacteroidales bacterium]